MSTEISNLTSASVEKLLLAHSADGEEWAMSIRVWAPVPSNVAGWCCQVEITRLFTPPKCIYGEDSWQALLLAMQFATTLVRHFTDKGGKLYWYENSGDGERYEFNVNELLPLNDG